MPTTGFRSGDQVIDHSETETGVEVEVLTTTACERCLHGLRLVESVLAEPAFVGVRWRRVDVVTEIDHAVELGCMAVPAIAIAGELVFSSLPSASRLRQVLRERLGRP